MLSWLLIASALVALSLADPIGDLCKYTTMPDNFSIIMIAHVYFSQCRRCLDGSYSF